MFIIVLIIKKQMKRIYCVLSVLVLSVLFLFLFSSSSLVSAANVPIEGQAEIEATDFLVKFSDCPAGVVCNVKIDNATGIFSGQAFSDDLGPVEFGVIKDNNENIISGPVKLDLTTGEVSGKALFLNTEDFLDFNSNPNGSDVSLNFNTEKNLKGHVWSVSNGYINFAGVSISLGSKLLNVADSLIATTASNWSTSVAQFFQIGNNVVGVKDSGTGKRLAEMNIDFKTNIDWSGVVGDSGGSRAFFHAPTNVSDITGGASTSYTLYVVKEGGDKVLICPGALSLAEINPACKGGYYLSNGETLNGATASVVVEDGVEYWKVTGLYSTGGMSLITGLKDILTRLKVGEVSNHSLSFVTNFGITASTDNFVLYFPDFNLSSVVIGDIDLSVSVVPTTRTLCTGANPCSAGSGVWGVNIDSANDMITFTAPTGASGYISAYSRIFVNILNNHITNPTSVGNYPETVTINSANSEEGTLIVPIVDSDRVNITGYVSSFLYFDIDTNTDNSDCAYSVCKIHGGVGAAAGTNYTVDLGELKSTYLNKSLNSVTHSDGIPGLINSIYFDLTTNAITGAVIRVKSANGGLQGPPSNLITSITDGQNILINSGTYGFNMPVAGEAKHGSFVANSSCDTASTYCGAVTSSMKNVYTTGGHPIDSGRARMDIAAGASYTNNPGTYTDTLTFVATSTF
jgi:hypothetical protein